MSNEHMIPLITLYHETYNKPEEPKSPKLGSLFHFQARELNRRIWSHLVLWIVNANGSDNLRRKTADWVLVSFIMKILLILLA